MLNLDQWLRDIWKVRELNDMKIQRLNDCLIDGEGKG